MEREDTGGLYTKDWQSDLYLVAFTSDYMPVFFTIVILPLYHLPSSKSLENSISIHLFGHNHCVPGVKSFDSL